MSKTEDTPKRKKRLSKRQRETAERNSAIGRVAATRSLLTNNIMHCENLLTEDQRRMLIRARSLVNTVYNELAFKYYKNRR